MTRDIYCTHAIRHLLVFVSHARALTIDVRPTWNRLRRAPRCSFVVIGQCDANDDSVCECARVHTQENEPGAARTAERLITN